MQSSTRSWARSSWVAVRALLVLTVILGIGYPLVVTGIAAVAMPHQAGGSLLTGSDGTVIGSRLLGQSFTGPDGKPLAKYFQSRPSAAGENGYDASNSSGTNAGPENPDLIASIKQRKAEIAKFNAVSEDQVPPDAVTASSSGLDPHISPAYASIQVQRVARARGLSEQQVKDLVQANTRSRDLGFMGDPAVNVLELNLALDKLKG